MVRADRTLMVSPPPASPCRKVFQLPAHFHHPPDTLSRRVFCGLRGDHSVSSFPDPLEKQPEPRHQRFFWNKSIRSAHKHQRRDWLLCTCPTHTQQLPAHMIRHSLKDQRERKRKQPIMTCMSWQCKTSLPPYTPFNTTIVTMHSNCF